MPRSFSSSMVSPLATWVDPLAFSGVLELDPRGLYLYMYDLMDVQWVSHLSAALHSSAVYRSKMGSPHNNHCDPLH